MFGIKHKVSMIILLAVLFIMTNSLGVFAATDFGEFAYWYSDSSQISYFNLSSINTIKYKFTGFDMSQTNFDTCTNNAINSWFSAVGLSNTYVTDQSKAQIEVFGFSRADANGYGVPSNAGGVTAFDSTRLGTATFAGSTKYVNKIIPTVDVYFAWDTGSKYNTGNFTLTQWKQVFAHELGHAIGYEGHYNNTTGSSLMYATTGALFNQTITTPSTLDKNHMHNPY